MIIGIVNYSMGNIGSIEKKIAKLGYRTVIGADPITLNHSDKLILPGVGHFANAKIKLEQLGLWNYLNHEVLIRKTPILGICLGLQLMAKHSEEGNVDGFGWFDADVVHFNIQDQLKHKVPHMGWNNVNAMKQSALFDGIPESREFYFVHSYHIKSNKKEDVLATTDYEYNFVSALEKDHIFGVQFHPEKSHDVGEKLLSNFLKL